MEKEINFENDKIIIDNSLIESTINGLTLNSFKLLMFLCAEFSLENLIDRDIAYQLEFRNKDFLDSIDYISKDGYSKLKKYLEELRKVTVKIPIWDNGKLAGAIITGLILKAEALERGITTVTLDKDIMPYLNTIKVEANKTIFRYTLQKQFESQFSARIYFLIYRWKNTNHKKVTLEIEELKEKLGIKGKYEDIKNFETRVLKVAKKEINFKSDVLMDYKKLAMGESTGKGRKPITHIEFTFKMKNQQQEEELLTESQIKELLEIAEKRVIGTDKTGRAFYEYALAVTLDGCKNNRGFYKYMKSVIINDNVYLGQVSMFTNPEVRAKVKANQIHNEIVEEQKRKTALKKAEIETMIESEKEEMNLKIEHAKKTGELKSISEILGRNFNENH